MHLSDHEIITIIAGGDNPSGHQHLQGCDRCRDVADLWQGHLGDLRLLSAESVHDRELHKLVVMFREYGGGSRLTTWIAEMVRSTLSRPAVAVRGGGGGIMELAAGPYRVVLQTSPHQIERAVAVHGQLLNDDAGAVGRGRMVLSSEFGAGFFAHINEHGEFHVSCVPVGTYSASWWVPAGRIHIDEIEVGNGDPS